MLLAIVHCILCFKDLKWFSPLKFWTLFCFYLALPGTMHQMWLFSIAQCVLSVSVISMNVRLCMRSDLGSHIKSVSSCLKLCLGWVGIIGGAMDIPVNILLNLRSPQCLYMCMMLVCFPLLVRQFTVWLLLFLILNTHLHCRLGRRWVEGFLQWTVLSIWATFLTRFCSPQDIILDWIFGYMS